VVKKFKASLALEPLDQLGEGPVWDAAQSRLLLGDHGARANWDACATINIRRKSDHSRQIVAWTFAADSLQHDTWSRDN
jgi:sugar lactone lactonase YvrE